MFDHRVAQLRQERIDAAARAQTAKTYAERGFTILDERPGWRDQSWIWLRYLRTADSKEATESVGRS